MYYQYIIVLFFSWNVDLFLTNKNRGCKTRSNKNPELHLTQLNELKEGVAKPDPTRKPYPHPTHSLYGLYVGREIRTYNYTSCVRFDPSRFKI